MFTMTDMIEINKIYKDTLRVQGIKKANEYYSDMKSYIKKKFNVSEEMYRSLWNASCSINSQY